MAPLASSGGWWSLAEPRLALVFGLPCSVRAGSGGVSGWAPLRKGVMLSTEPPHHAEAVALRS